MASISTLTTDFGTQDTYVGVMKGTIAHINPSATIIDLTHHILPQDIGAAQFALMNAYPYFPTGTVHVVVVDPGVGTARRAIAVQLPQGYLVGPDNGVLSGVLTLEGAIAAVALTNPHYWRTPQPSPTFHGRDIFAPVAAHLAAGVPLAALGEAITIASLATLAWPAPTITATAITGHIQAIDHFGNLITTIPAAAIRRQNWVAQVGGVPIPAHLTYGDVPMGQPLLLVGSHGWVEVAVNGGSAQQHLRLQVGDVVTLHCPHS